MIGLLAPAGTPSAWRLTLGGLAVASAGLGGLASGLLARLRTLRCQCRSDGLAVLLRVPAGGALQGGLFSSLRSHRDGRLQNSRAASLGSLRGRPLPRRFAALPPGLVRVRHRRLPRSASPA